MTASRKMTARSVLLSTLLGSHPPALPVRVLVRSGELFGIAEGASRVALSRMLAAGEVAQDDDGRYRLAGRLLDRQTRQDVGRRPPARAWRGEWATAVVTAEGRSPTDRAALRSTMRDLRMGELREGVWARPANLWSSPPEDGQCTWFRSRPEDDAAALARKLWDVDGVAAEASELRRGLAAQPLDAADDLAPAFVLSAAVLRFFQADPLLPAPVLPADWPGAALRADYEDFDARFRRLWRTFVSQ